MEKAAFIIEQSNSSGKMKALVRNPDRSMSTPMAYWLPGRNLHLIVNDDMWASICAFTEKNVEWDDSDKSPAHKGIRIGSVQRTSTNVHREGLASHRLAVSSWWRLARHLFDAPPHREIWKYHKVYEAISVFVIFLWHLTLRFLSYDSLQPHCS